LSNVEFYFFYRIDAIVIDCVYVELKRRQGEKINSLDKTKEKRQSSGYIYIKKKQKRK